MDLGRPAIGILAVICPRTLLVAAVSAVAIAATPALATEPSGDGMAQIGSAQTTGAYIPTDGMLTSREARHLRRVAAARRARVQQAEDTSAIWLFDYIGRMFDHEPSVARRRRGSHRVASQPTLSRSAAAGDQPTALDATKPTAFALSSQSAPAVTPAQQPTSAIVTGSLSPSRPVVVGAAPDSMDPLIIAAERSQARIDLVKLEFASRTYDERKLSGQQVFEIRSDWHVLERARDALAEAEAASARAVGFEANAYINETTRTIVVAVAGAQDLRREFLAVDAWNALIKAEAPQQFYLAKTYVRSVIQRYQMRGFSTECVGHSLGGAACAYVASELGIRALVLNPISAGKLAASARFQVTNYIVDGELADLIYGVRSNSIAVNGQANHEGRDAARQMTLEKFGTLSGPILVVRDLKASAQNYTVDRALEQISAQAETPRPR